MKEVNFNKKIKISLVFLLIAIVSILCIIINNTATYVNKLSGIENDQMLANLGTHINEISGAGNDVGEIIIGGTYRNGFCVMFKGNIYGGVSNANKKGSAYSINSNGQIRWLLDNMYLPYGSQTDELKALYKENIKLKTGFDVSKLTSEEIYTVEQYVLWKYTDGRFGRPDPSSYITQNANRKGFYDALIVAANKNTNYKSNGKNTVIINKTNAKVKINGTNMIIGPFKLKDNKVISSLISTVKLNDKTVNSVMYKDEKCTTKLNKYTDINDDNEFYIKIADINKNTNYKVNVTFTGNTYSTDAIYWETNWGETPQPVVTLSRTLNTINDVFSGEYNVPEDFYDLYVQKIDDISQSALSGVQLKISKDSIEIKNEKTNSYGYVIAKNQKIAYGDTNKKDVYKITEVKGLDSYFKLKDPVTIYVTKDTTNLKVNSVSFSSSSNVTTKEVSIEDSNYKVTLQLKLNSDGTRVDLIIPNLEKKFDLALRKIIKSVNRNDSQIYNGETAGRYPELNVFSVIQLIQNGTIQYNNKKDPVKVKVGDRIIYTLRIYNEGTVKGFVDEITDYLPEGLKLADNSQINDKYGWTEENGKVVSKNIDFDIDSSNRGKEIAKMISGSSYNTFYKDVEIECEVTGTFKGVLTNVSEMTSYGGYFEGQRINAGYLKIDIDSTPNNVFNLDVINNQQYFKQYIVDDSITKYYEGIEDDDDFENIEVEGQYDIEIEKIDSSNQNKKLEGIQFRIEQNITENNYTSGVLSKKTYTTNSEGKINLPTQIINKNHYNCVDTYNIEEIDVGNNGYIKLKYPFTIDVTKTVTDDGEYKLSSFQVKGQDLSYASISSDNPGTNRTYYVYDEAGKKVTINVNLEEKSNKISIKISNNPLETINLNIKKVDMDDENKTLSNARFTIDGPDGNIQTDKGFENGQLEFTKENVELNTTYEYTIQETSPEALYENLFEGYLVKLNIKTNEKGKIDKQKTTVGIVAKEGIQEDADKISKASEALRLEIDEQTNTVKLTIKNPQKTQGFELSLNKHNLDSTEGINEAVFEVYNSNENAEELEKINEITTEKGKTQQIVKVSNSILDKTYYYLIKETKVPNNYQYKYQKILVKVIINTESVVTSSIEKVYDTQWRDYEESKYLSIEQNNQNIIKIGVANSLKYQFGLYKKDFAGENDISTANKFSGTANFEIKQVYPIEQVIHNGTLEDAQKLFNNMEAKANGVYKYEITETSVSDDYYNTLVGKTIVVTIRTDENGNVKPNTYGGTEYVFKDEQNLTEQQKSQLYSLIDLKIGENNQIDFYIANIPVGFYQLQLIKTDATGRVINDETEFQVQLPVALENGETTFTGTTRGAVLVTPTQPLESGKVHDYIITETKSPTGYKILDKNINLSVDLRNITAFNEITRDMITYSYGDEGETLEGIKIHVENGLNIPMIQIYIPNDAEQYIFELRKQDFSGNLITSDENENHQIDGSQFYVHAQQPIAIGTTNVPEGTKFENKTIIDGYLKNGVIDENVVAYKNLRYIYDITEKQAKKGYFNVLGQYTLRVIVETGEDSKISNVYYQIRDTQDHFNDITSTFNKKYGQYIDVSKEQNTEKVIVKVKNSVGYKVRLNKVNTNDMAISTATITARYNNIDECILNKTQKGETSHTSENSFPISIGETQKWRIEEHFVKAPYKNIFEGKYIEVDVTMDENSKIKVSGYTIKDAQTDSEITGEELTKLKSYVRSINVVTEDNISIVDITLRNPLEFKFELLKVESDNEQTELSGAVLKVNDEIVISDGSSKYEKTISEISPKSLQDFTIEEISTVENHINILENKQLNVRMSINNNCEVDYLDYYIKDKQTNMYIGDKTNPIFNYIKVSANRAESGEVTLSVKILNPTMYNFELTKTDTQGNVLTGTDFEITSPVIKEQNGIYVSDIQKQGISRIDSQTGIMYGQTTQQGKISFQERYVLQGQTYEYKIIETQTSDKQYVNILKDYALYVKVNVGPNGVILLENYNNQRNYIIKDNDGGEAPEKYYNFINVSIENNTVKVQIQNPLEIKVKLNKKIYGEENINLANAVFEINSSISGKRTVTTDDLGNIEFTEELVSAGQMYEYTIKEINTPYEDILNILQGHYIKVKIQVNSDGTITIIKNDEEKSYTIYDDNDNGIKHKDTYIYEYVNVDSTNLQDTSVLNINVSDPQKYKLELSKIDLDTKQSIEGVKFDIKVFDSDGLEVKLKDTNTMTVKDLTNTKTDSKGKITLDNIMFEKTGKYTFILHETTPELYKQIEDIKIDVSISMEGGKYKIYDMSIIQGKNNVNEQNTNISNENNIQKINIEVINEKSEFDLSLRKFITQIIENEGQENENIRNITNRVPEVNTQNLLNETNTTSVYNHTKQPINVYAGNTVIYTLRVYNEGEISGYAEEIVDHLPEGLEFVDDEFNKEYGWIIDTKDETLRTIKTNYLSKATNQEDNLIKAYDKEKDNLFYKELRIKCKVKENAKLKANITNIAEITKYTSESTQTVIDRDSNKLVELPTDEQLPNYKNDEMSNTYIPGQEDDDDFEKIVVQKFDLALRKFITKVTRNEKEIDIGQSREPVFKLENSKFIYEHTKEPVIALNQDIVEYTLRVYNEGTLNGYASLIKDDIPKGIEFIVDNETNKKYGWTMLDKDGNSTQDVTKAVHVVTDYLSKEKQQEEGQNLLKAFDNDKYQLGEIYQPDYKEVEVAFKVTSPNTSDKIIINLAQISDDSNEQGEEIEDKDSHPNKWIDGEDDQDYEQIKQINFDLSLRKWVTKAIVIEDGKETITQTGHKAEDDPEDIVKVEVNKNKLNSVVVKFEYKIRVTNEGNINGYVKEISDYIPDGLKFNKEDNLEWEQVEGKVTTDKLKDTLLKPGESAEVTILLTWINAENNMGLKVNTAEISEDYNDYDVPDNDSTPNNKIPGEDDIDDAPVMLAISTGRIITYFTISLLSLAVLVIGVGSIKKFVL